MPLLPDSGDPDNMHDQLGLGNMKPELLTDPTWQHICRAYQLRGDLGKGGQAVVLLVKERAAPHRRLAIKVYHENTETARKLFDHECRVLASDHLPQDLVVGYIQCVSDPGLQPYVVLEHIDGKPIVEYVQAARSMSVNEKISLWEKLCRSLHRLHQCHLVFGDLSPKNVLVEKDDVIRFIDLAGSKPLKKAYSDSQSSQNIATPNVMPAAWLIGEARTALWTDIYAASAIGFEMLTAQDKGDFPAAQWEVKLKSHGVPSGIRRVVLKGLREKATNKTDDPSLYPTAEYLANDISNWRTTQLRRRTLLQQSVVLLALLLIVGGIGAVGWMKYEEERQALVSRDIEWAKSMRESLGEVLNESPWLMSAKAIAERKNSLARRFLQLKEELAAGRTDNLQPTMATLHRDLAKLAQDNTLALPAEQRRLEYERLAKSVAEELRGKDGFDQIAKSVQDSEHLLNEGKWRDAEMHFGSCTQRLNDWLTKNETPKQRADRLKADQERVAVLELEKKQLEADVTRVNKALNGKESEIAKLNENLAKLGTDAANARIAEQKATDTLKSEQAKLASLQKMHKEASDKLAQANLDLAAAKPKLDSFDVTAKKLDELTKERDRWKSDTDALAKQVAALSEAAGTDKKLTVAEMPDPSRAAVPSGNEYTSKSTGMKLALIPAGTFTMGSPSSEAERSTDEGPTHSVRISQPIYMGLYEVKQGEYESVMGTNPSSFKTVSGQDTSKFPVDSVSWNDSVEFCKKLSVKDGVTYRLPTEAEWEYAARAGTTTPFHFGSTLNGDQANVDGNSPYGTTTKGPYLQRTTTVGSYSKNAFGLFDMHGNVREWCEDVYDQQAYSKRSGTTVDLTVTSGSEYRVLRGGSWFGLSQFARSAYRDADTPDNRRSNYGFRVVTSASAVSMMLDTGNTKVKAPLSELPSTNAPPRFGTSVPINPPSTLRPGLIPIVGDAAVTPKAKMDPVPEIPNDKVLIDTDFSSADPGLLPRGWTCREETISVQNVGKGKNVLQLELKSSPTAGTVSIPLPRPMKGNFKFECRYSLRGYVNRTREMEVGFLGQGKARVFKTNIVDQYPNYFVDQGRFDPDSAKDGYRLEIKREGEVISTSISGNPVRQTKVGNAEISEISLMLRVGSDGASGEPSEIRSVYLEDLAPK